MVTIYTPWGDVSNLLIITHLHLFCLYFESELSYTTWSITHHKIITANIDLLHLYFESELFHNSRIFGVDNQDLKAKLRQVPRLTSCGSGSGNLSRPNLSLKFRWQFLHPQTPSQSQSPWFNMLLIILPPTHLISKILRKLVLPTIQLEIFSFPNL